MDSDLSKKDFVGLHQLYPQLETAETSFDLVVVHGLAGGSISTWRHENGSLWLEWLTTKISSLRILVFGYSASDVYLKSDDGTASTGRVFTFAESLCASLRNYQIKKKNPITFIGHGVGGIIVKNALTYSTARRTLFGDIVDQTHHIVFLDTPHLGLDVTKWKAIYGQLATREARTQFELWSTTLQDLSTTFADIVSRPDMHITTVESTEAIKTPDGEMLVMPVGSARLFNASNEITLHMHAVSHLSMCRFEDTKDGNYDMLERAIETQIKVRRGTEADLAMEEAGLRPLAFTARTDSELQKLAKVAQQNSGKLDRDRTDDNVVNWARDLERAPVAADDTCTWLFEHPEFIAWRDSPCSRLSLLHGIQGCGKSTLVAYMINDLQKHGKPIAYFFCSEKSSSPVTRLRALGYQLLRRFDDDMVIRLLSDRYEKMPDDIGTVSAAKGILKDALMASPSCTIAIDALDEISPENRDREIFVRALADLIRDIPFELKILCSSRNVSGISNLFARARLDVADIAIGSDLINDDIRRVIEIETRKQGLAKRIQNEGEMETIRRNLLEGSQGMFLLPVMMIKDLVTKPTLQDVYDFFKELPTDLHGYYTSILDKIDSRRLSNLSLAQVKEALSFDGARFLDLESDIKSAFGCLVSVEDGQIKLSHPSVRRYIVSSKSFRASKWYDRLTTSDPEKYLGELCLRYLERCDIPPSPPPIRFATVDLPTTLREQHPFLDYASIYWLSHCASARYPRALVPMIQDLVSSNNSQRLLGWYCAAMQFLDGIEGFRAICKALQIFALSLETRAGEEELDNELLQQIYAIDKAVRSLLRFDGLWGQGFTWFPSELDNLAPLLHNPYRLAGPKYKQQSLIMQEFVSANAHHAKALDNRHLNEEFDRFLLTDTNIFMWTSLMPCTPFDRRHTYHLDPAEPSVIKFFVESIYSPVHETDMRQGRDPAEVGAFPAGCVVSPSRENVALVWPRFSQDKSEPAWVKTYLWGLTEDDDEKLLTFTKWTVAAREDPCRANRTQSRTFQKSRQAVAFTEDSLQLWTAGGLYDISDGRHYPPPDLFYNDEMSELTFAEYGNAIVGMRKNTQLEVYELSSDRCQLRATAPNVSHVLAVSPHGKFTLCLSGSTTTSSAVGNSPDPSAVPHSDESIGLLVNDGTYTILWRYSSVVASATEGDAADLPSLQYFYNNGGLHAFSDNEAVLVLCVPTVPCWSLLAFDLKSGDIARSVWRIEFNRLFDGAELTSFCFSRTEDRQLYLLDGFGNMRTLSLSRKSNNTTSTLQNQKQIMLLSGIYCEGNSHHVYSSSLNPMTRSATLAEFRKEDPQDSFPLPAFEASITRVDTLVTSRSKQINMPYIRHFRNIKSKTVVVDYDPILQAIANGQNVTNSSWGDWLPDHAQFAIEATTEGNQESIADWDLAPEESLKDTAPRITTSVTFDTNVTRAFVHSVIYNPVASLRGQPRWVLTMIMDVRSTETLVARKTGKWRFALVGTVSQEDLASAYHHETKLIAYSVSLLYRDRTTETHSWFLTRLCLCHLADTLHAHAATDPRGTFLDSVTYRLCTGDGVIQFDVKKGTTVRIISTADYNLTHMTLVKTTETAELSLAGVSGPQVIQFTLPFAAAKDTKVKMRHVFTGPYIQKHYERLTFLTEGERLTAVFTGRNYLRKDGVEGGITALEPIVLTSLEGVVGDWSETDLTVEETYDKEEDLREIVKEGLEEFEVDFAKWAARQGGGSQVQDQGDKKKM
ncbi:hypothetical protein B0T19DRAFT_452137 [Cercophora scortea]|uniref:NACHT domain-containing protein n=1 Tax=Cercophora scortea TaxID=314031 RepID=A0AAE0J1P1_9PEZI|nr:hypothetical protein B0T19DRAFT_452137 [Cercophora scortea]